MEINLTPRAEELLRSELARHPGRSAAEIVEDALLERAERELPRAKKLTPEEFDKWAETFAQFSDKIPPMDGETFSHETIYQNHD